MGGQPARTLQGTEMADTEEASGQDSAVPGSMLPQGQKCTRPRPEKEAEQRAGTGASSGGPGAQSRPGTAPTLSTVA